MGVVGVVEAGIGAVSEMTLAGGGRHFRQQQQHSTFNLNLPQSVCSLGPPCSWLP